jgi:hypothetical protein
MSSIKTTIIAALGLICLLATAGGLAIAPAHAQGEL